MEEAVQSEDEKNQAEEKTGDDSNDFHVKICLLDIKYIDINIYVVKANINETETQNQGAGLRRRPRLARFHESLSSPAPPRGREHQANRTGRLRFPRPGSPLE